MSANAQVGGQPYTAATLIGAVRGSITATLNVVA
jgi:hypothetical protein